MAMAFAMAMAAAPARAHDPFDGGIELVVFKEKIEVTVTLGYDAARALLRGAQLPHEDIARITRNAPTRALVPLPLTIAPGLFRLTALSQPVAPTALLALPGETESVFILIYPRPEADQVVVQAPFVATIEHMHPTMLIVTNQRRIMLGTALLSASMPSVQASLTRPAANGYQAPAVGADSRFKPGVGYIPSGYEYLSIVVALLAGGLWLMRRP